MNLWELIVSCQSQFITFKFYSWILFRFFFEHNANNSWPQVLEFSTQALFPIIWYSQSSTFQLALTTKMFWDICCKQSFPMQPSFVWACAVALVIGFVYALCELSGCMPLFSDEESRGLTQSTALARENPGQMHLDRFALSMFYETNVIISHLWVLLGICTRTTELTLRPSCPALSLTHGVCSGCFPTVLFHRPVRSLLVPAFIT